MRFLPFTLFIFSLSSGYSEILTYQSVLEGMKTLTTWNIEKTENQIDIKGQNRGNEVELQYTPNFNLTHYLEKDPKNQIFEISKDNANLLVKQNNKTKSLKLGTSPWIQEFKFGFLPFLKSTSKEHLFSIVYNKDISIHEMVATKETIETIQIDGKSFETQKLKITLKGFKKRFWKAEAWFDLKTHEMLKYRSNEGPGTPFVEVTLLK